MDKDEQSRHIQAGYEAARERKIHGLQSQVAQQAERIKELEQRVEELQSFTDPLWPV